MWNFWIFICLEHGYYDDQTLWNIDLKSLEKEIDIHKFEMLKIKFKNIRCIVIDKVSNMSALLLSAVSKKLQ